MLAGAPVTYDRGESIPDLLVEAVRARQVLDPGAVAPLATSLNNNNSSRHAGSRAWPSAVAPWVLLPLIRVAFAGSTLAAGRNRRQ